MSGKEQFSVFSFQFSEGRRGGLARLLAERGCSLKTENRKLKTRP
jgi:hypothetical protein